MSGELKARGACSQQLVKIPTERELGLATDNGLSLAVAVILGVARSRKRREERIGRFGQGGGDNERSKEFRNLRLSVDRKRGLIWREARSLCQRLGVDMPVTMDALPVFERHFSADITVFSAREDTAMYPQTVRTSVNDILMTQWRVQNGAAHRVVLYHTLAEDGCHHFDYV